MNEVRWSMLTRTKSKVDLKKATVHYIKLFNIHELLQLHTIQE